MNPNHVFTARAFKPNLRLEIHDASMEETKRGGNKVAEVLSDGRRGYVHVFDARHQRVIDGVFQCPVAAGGGARDQRGICVDFDKTISQWSREGMTALAEYTLRAHGFRCVFVRI